MRPITHREPRSGSTSRASATPAGTLSESLDGLCWLIGHHWRRRTALGSELRDEASSVAISVVCLPLRHVEGYETDPGCRE